MNSLPPKKALFWFRRDLRIKDNCALYHALNECDTVAPVFIFDKTILNELPASDRRVEFIWNAIALLKSQFNQLGSDIIVRFAHAEKEIPLLADKYKVQAVYTNEDYEPASRQRDGIVEDALKILKIEFKSYKDNVIFNANEILTPQRQPFTVFSHYRLAWRKSLQAKDYQSFSSENLTDKLAKFSATNLLSLEDMGFEKTNLNDMRLQPDNIGASILFERFKNKVIGVYKTARDIPSISGVSYLSVYNRFGLISIRELISQVIRLRKESNEKRKESCDAWIDELIWREFYFQLLYHYPHIAYEPFNSIMKNFPWENNPFWFQAWCEGKTGYPIIDAAMIQLNNTGYMHNRLRMMVASFLTKHLLIDYRMGEFYFANKLLDFDLSANNGGWQWAASTGSDAQNYTRIFSPIKQSEKFDSDAKFIKKYLPVLKDIPAKYLHEPWEYQEELEYLGVVLGKDYPLPIVSHKERREIALNLFNEFLHNIEE